MNKASGISRQVIETRRAIRKMKPKIKASNEGEFKHFEITGLQDLTKFGMEIRYAYLQIRGSDQLILYSPKLERQPDGTYMLYGGRNQDNEPELQALGNNP